MIQISMPILLTFLTTVVFLYYRIISIVKNLLDCLCTTNLGKSAEIYCYVYQSAKLYTYSLLLLAFTNS